MSINRPNQITIARLLMAVLLFVCLAQYDAKSGPAANRLLDLAAGLFIVAALSDILDGYLARRHNQVTSFGRVLDPFVDKILVLGTYIFLAGDSFVDPNARKLSDLSDWMVVAILGRELLVTSLRGVEEAGGQAFGANVYGKAKMVLQSVTVVWVLVTIAHPGVLFGIPALLRPGVVYLMVVVTVLSAIPYLLAARGVLSQLSVSR